MAPPSGEECATQHQGPAASGPTASVSKQTADLRLSCDHETSAEVVYMKLCRKQLSVHRGGGRWFKVSCINSAALLPALRVQSPCSTACIDLQRLPGPI
ncbi:unnamed protein product [Pleuronectes platessa]|uniref:Uncharacterized protein n=1 Tax=Pleuronectes platessa TaxID=8262 RepID=A0A9N7YW69_PLEPL|nr:unnamed protein product [Pleuronectes platessa]